MGWFPAKFDVAHFDYSYFDLIDAPIEPGAFVPGLVVGYLKPGVFISQGKPAVIIAQK